jgi:hypothetical protein
MGDDTGIIDRVNVPPLPRSARAGATTAKKARSLKASIVVVTLDVVGMNGKGFVGVGWRSVIISVQHEAFHCWSLGYEF